MLLCVTDPSYRFELEGLSMSNSSSLFPEALINLGNEGVNLSA